MEVRGGQWATELADGVVGRRVQALRAEIAPERRTAEPLGPTAPPKHTATVSLPPVRVGLAGTVR